VAQIAVFLPVFVKTSPTSFAKCCSASRTAFHEQTAVSPLRAKQTHQLKNVEFESHLPLEK